jgi:SAM-dependent methyltransferase
VFEPDIFTIVNAEPAEMERNDGIRRMLRLAPVYRAVQRSIGGERTRQRVRNEVIRSSADDLIVDIGCGTSEIADYVLFGEYYGFDPHEKYVDEACSRLTPEFGDRVSVFVGSIGEEGIDSRLPARADLVTSIGVLHHVDDELADSLLELAARLAGGSGRFVSLDPAYHDGQPAVARFLASRDRGQHVRRSDEVEALVRRHFSAVECTVHHDLLRVPYTHVAVRATNS